ncbi:MAG: DUF1552 domain-containing protein [Myxococcota bacterium]
MSKRRSFLKGMVGTAAVTLPLPRLAEALDDTGERLADGTPIPPRFGLWFFGNGIDPARWHPSGSGGVGDAWSLSEQLMPLASFKDQLTVLSGFEVKTGGAHVGGSAGATTGANVDDRGAAQLPSIDQVIADRISAATPFRSIEVGLSRATPAGSEIVLHTVSHQGPGAPNYPEYDPHRLFARLFGVSASSPELRAARRSVLDGVLSDLRSLQNRVGAADRRRLTAHAEGVRALERRLAMSSEGCGLVDAPPADLRADDREEAPMMLHDAMSRMIALSLSCGLTNVFTYMFTLPAGHVYYRHLGSDFDRSFHEDIVHLVDGIPNGPELVTRGVQYAMESFAITLGHLRDVPFAGPGTLLDELCVLGTSEVSAGWTHDMQDFPLLLAGHACGRLAGNTHLRVSGQPTASEVLMTLANLYGANVRSYGRAEARADREVSGLLRAS